MPRSQLQHTSTIKAFSIGQTLIRPLKLGFEGDNFDHQNRLTLICNFTAYLCISIFLLHSKLMLDANAPFWHTAIFTLQGVFFGSAVLTLNYLHKHSWARFMTVLGALSIGWRCYFIIGKVYNGHYVFFVALALSIIAFKKEDWKFMWISVALTLVSLPLGDALTYYGYLPMISFELDVGLPALIIDALMISSVFAVCIYLEKSLSESFRDELKSLNNSLEHKVELRSEQLKKAKEEAESAALLKSQFITNTSHEIRTPLNGIKGFLSLLKIKTKKLNEDNVEQLGEKILEYGDQVESSIQRLDELLYRLVNLTQLQDGNLEPHPVDFKFSTLVDEHLEKRHKEIERKRLRVQTIIPEDEGLCFQDRSISSVIVANLLDNAIKYSIEDEDVQIRLSFSNGTVQLNISNVGPGIPEDEKLRVFEPFTQSSLTDKGVGGTGLGLAFCKRYSELLEGDIFLKDSRPECTTFTLELPEQLGSRHLLKGAA